MSQAQIPQTQNLRRITNNLEEMTARRTESPKEASMIQSSQWYTEDGQGPLPLMTKADWVEFKKEWDDKQRQLMSLESEDDSETLFPTCPQIRLELTHSRQPAESHRPHWLRRLIQRLLRPFRQRRERPLQTTPRQC